MTVCATCEAPVKYVRPEPGDYTSLGQHVHTDGERDHPATPKPTCPTCGSTEYRVTHGAWGDSWDCGSCGHHDYFSLGD